MDENDIDVVQTTFNTSHLLAKILEYVLEQRRGMMYMVGTRSRQGDLKGFLNLRIINHHFDQAVCATVRVEFRKIEVDIDNHFIRCNCFTIGRHQKPADQPQRNQAQAQNQPPLQALAHLLDAHDLVAENDNQADEVAPIEAPEDAADEAMEDEDLLPDDSLDATFLQNFFKWLADTFDPIVESFTIHDTWSLTPCSLPASWSTRLQTFHCMHPDMKYCKCEQCIETIRNCHKYFGPMSFQMMQDALIGQTISFGTIAFTDAFLADIALSYSLSIDDRRTFEPVPFVEHFGSLRCEQVIFAVQTLAPYPGEHPKPQPLEVIQMLLKLWEVKTVEFEIVRFMENDYYIHRCSWAEEDVFHKAYFATYNNDSFNIQAHVTPYEEAGTLDSELRYDCLPIFDLRIDTCEPPNRMSSNLSLLSLASEIAEPDYFTWLHIGRIAFKMFRSNKIMFVSSGIVDFRGEHGTADWLKFTVREIMRNTWGPRSRNISESGKTVFWIHYVDDANEYFRKVWAFHAREIFAANFPNLELTMNTKDAFTKCEHPRVGSYNSLKRPDTLRGPMESFCVSFYDPIRRNTTNIKLVHVEF